MADIAADRTPDLDLLGAYARSRDAQAFAELVHRYAGMVYGTAVRVTHNPADALDVSQECFLALAVEARTGRLGDVRSLPGWLHAMARSRSVDVTRRSSARRRREQQAAAAIHAARLDDWDAVQPHVDAAIAQLPDELRDLVTRHFLCGISQSDLAAATGLSQPTVSRRLAEAVGHLRESLARSGVTLSVAGLATGLEQCHPISIPPALTASLGKLAISGLPAAGVNAKLVAAIVAAALLAAGLLLFTQFSTRNTAMPTTSPTGPAASPNADDRLVLQGVPQIGYVVNGRVRLCPFPGSLESLMQYIGDPCDYDQVMAVSGGAFRRFFNKDDGGNVSLEYTAPNCYEHALAALGYQFTVIKALSPEEAGPVALAENRGQIRAAIKRSLQAGRPVLASVAGPECGLVCGYEQGGDVLLGWSYFRDGRTGYYREANWTAEFQGSPYLVFLGEKVAKPDDRTTLVATLQHALRLSRGSASELGDRPRPDHAGGLAAYDAWADGLEVDADFPADDRQSMSTRSMVHNDQCDMTTDRRHAAIYLQRMADAFPEAAEPLESAAGLYQEVADLAGGIRAGNGRWNNPAALAALADPANRRRYSAVVRDMRDRETAAVAELERALDLLSPISPQAQIPLPPAGRKDWIEGFGAPGGLRPLMQAVGDRSGFAETGDWYATEIFPLFMGVCGDAFRFAWYREDGGPLQQADRYAVAPPATQYLPALAAAGFDGRAIFDPELTGSPPSPAWNAEALRREVVASIARRSWPVLIVDLPEPGWNAVITGYEDDGRTLTGWCEPGWESFGFRFDPAKKRSFADWFATAGGVVLLDTQHARPAEAEVHRAALGRAVAELRTRSAGHVLTGPATYEQLAERLDDPTLSDNDEATAKRRDALVFPMIWDLATQRHYAAGFLSRSAEVFPSAAEELTAASDRFTAIHDAIWQINRLGGGTNPGSPLPLLADPLVRAQVIAILLQCRDRDLQAADLIEKAMAAVR